MLNITEEQRKLFIEHLSEKELQNSIDDVLDVLDDKLTEIGFNADYSLNKVGLKLQRLYDELYSQN